MYWASNGTGGKDTMTTMVVVIRGGRAKLHKIKRDGGQIAQPRSQTNENLKIH